MKTYQNLEELRKSEPHIAKELEEEYRDDVWTEDDWSMRPIRVFESMSEFARHEIRKGPFSRVNREIEEHSHINPFDYVDFRRFGEDLLYRNNDRHLYLREYPEAVVELSGREW